MKNRKYKMKITPDSDQFVAEFLGLQGCQSVGKTVRKAKRNGRKALNLWLNTAEIGGNNA